MKIGKIPPDVLQSQILPFAGAKRKEVLVGPKYGEDCAVIELGDELLVLSTDPITGAVSGLGRLAVHIACNDVAAAGAEPVGLLLNYLFPEGTTQAEVQTVVAETHETASRLEVAVLGGHAEITGAVKQAVIAATAMGKVKREHLVTSSGARPGDEVMLTKWAGLEGTAILAADLGHRLREGLPAELLQRAEHLGEHLSVVPEGLAAARAGATAMHDATEGGIRGALTELAAASGVGLEIWQESIPLAPETEAICRFLQIDPLGLISSGAMVITAPPGSGVLEALQGLDVPACVIGRVREEPELYFISEGIKKELTAPLRDELYEALERYA